MPKYKVSSPVNSYGPMIKALSDQNKAASAKGAALARPARRLMLDAATQFDALIGGCADFTYTAAQGRQSGLLARLLCPTSPRSGMGAA